MRRRDKSSPRATTLLYTYSIGSITYIFLNFSLSLCLFAILVFLLAFYVFPFAFASFPSFCSYYILLTTARKTYKGFLLKYHLLFISTRLCNLKITQESYKRIHESLLRLFLTFILTFSAFDLTNPNINPKWNVFYMFKTFRCSSWI